MNTHPASVYSATWDHSLARKTLAALPAATPRYCPEGSNVTAC